MTVIRPSTGPSCKQLISYLSWLQCHIAARNLDIKYDTQVKDTNG